MSHYTGLKLGDFFCRVGTEEQAREFFWTAKFAGKPFECPRCCHERFYEIATRPEVRQCRQCGKQVRVRAGTALQDSKKPLLVWARAIFLMMQDKRGVSAVAAMRELGLKSYGTIWGMLHKIRRALGTRDEQYKIGHVVELDGATFKDQACGNGVREVLIAIESKDWMDEKGRPKNKAGFAKVVVARETKIFAQQFVDKALAPGTFVNADGGNSFTDLKGVDVDQQVMANQPERLDRWLPWVHRFISNAKTWLLGTHHGVDARYLSNYLAEHTYRFNRRHAPDTLFHRALTACARAPHVRLLALCE